MNVTDPGLSSSAESDLDDHRRRFLLVVMTSGIACAIVFVLSHFVGLNPLSREQIINTIGFVAISVPLAVRLWFAPGFYRIAVWGYAIATYLLFVSALYFVPNDELRVIWFFLLIAGTFVLIGTAAGWVTLGLVMVVFLAACLVGPITYSVNAIATFTICFVATGAFFHAANRQIVAFLRQIRLTTLELERASRTDALTGLANNRALADAWRRLAGETDTIGFLFLDVDHFKAINDSFGHASGDIVLKSIAESVVNAVGARAIAGRVGGEEFAILLPAVDLASSAVVAEKIRAAIEESAPTIDDHRLRVTASVGVAVSVAPHLSQGAVQRAADTALYEAKRRGRNRVVTAETA